MDLFLGIDIGTSGARSGIFDREGNPIIFCEEQFELSTPHSGWAEQNPDDWWNAVTVATRKALKDSNTNPSDIKGIGFDTTSCTVVVSKDDMVPLRPAIMWMDMRASDQARRIGESGHQMLKYNGFGPVSAECLPAKVLWLKENEPEIYNSATRVYECGDWLAYKLTGIYAASMNQATIRWYYDNRNGGYQKDFYAAIGLEDLFTKLPENVLQMGTFMGGLTEQAAEQLGLVAGTPVGQGGADACVGIIGLNAFKLGKLALVTGSSHLHLVQTDKEIHNTGMWGGYPDAIVDGLYMMEGGQTSSGSVINWVKNQLCGNYKVQAEKEGCSVYDILNREAEKLPIGADGLVALDYFQGNRTPYCDSNVRGLYYGLSLGHTPAHMYRASVESVCYGTQVIMDKFAENNITFDEIVISGGVVKSDFWLQAHADVANVKITVPKVSEAPCLGSAILGAVASGYYKNVAEAADCMVKAEKVIEPNLDRHNEYMFYYERYKELYPMLKDWMHSVTNHNKERQ